MPGRVVLFFLLGPGDVFREVKKGCSLGAGTLSGTARVRKSQLYVPRTSGHKRPLTGQTRRSDQCTLLTYGNSIAGR